VLVPPPQELVCQCVPYPCGQMKYCTYAFLRLFYLALCVKPKIFCVNCSNFNIAFGAYRRQKREENGRPEEGQEVQRVDQLSTGPRHEVG
jgi:hypothetical protein